MKSLQPKSCYCETTIEFIQSSTPSWRQKIAQWGQILSYLHTYLFLIHEILTHMYVKVRTETETQVTKSFWCTTKFKFLEIIVGCNFFLAPLMIPGPAKFWKIVGGRAIFARYISPNPIILCVRCAQRTYQGRNHSIF